MGEFLVNLDETKVRWYPHWKSRDPIMCQCGEFPNVPLMGTEGCVNYNPVLALRQMQFRIRGPPMDETLAPLFSTYLAVLHTGMIHRISRAWLKRVRKGVNATVGREISHAQWIRDRASLVGMPFTPTALLPEMPDPEPEEIGEEVLEELEEVKRRLAETEAELEALRLDCSDKDQSLQAANKRAREAEDAASTSQVRQSKIDTMEAAVDRWKEVADRRHTRLMQEREKNQRLEAAMSKEAQRVTVMQAEIQGLRGEAQKAAEMEVEIRRLGEVLKDCMNEISDLKKVARGAQKGKEDVEAYYGKEVERIHSSYREQLQVCKRRISGLVEELAAVRNNHAAITRGRLAEDARIDERVKEFVRDIGEEIELLEMDNRVIRRKAAAIIVIANQALDQVPKLLGKATLKMDEDNTPKEVFDFVNHCDEVFKKTVHILRFMKQIKEREYMMQGND